MHLAPHTKTLTHYINTTYKTQTAHQNHEETAGEHEEKQEEHLLVLMGFLLHLLYAIFFRLIVYTMPASLRLETQCVPMWMLIGPSHKA